MEQRKSVSIELFDINEDLILYIDAKEGYDIEIDIDNEYPLEPKYHLKEGRFYDYEFSDDCYRLVCERQENIIRKRRRNEHMGVIAPNIFVGTLSLEIYHVANPDNKYDFPIEIQSIKTSYRNDYQYMLNSIAEKCTDIILQSNSPVSHSFETDYDTDSKTLYQRFAFVKSMIESDEFEEAINRIISSPTTTWGADEEDVDIRRIKRFKKREINQLIRSKNRAKLPTNHPLSQFNLNSIANKIRTAKKIENVDTPENRFIKNALQTFSKFCYDIAHHKNADDRLKKEAENLTNKLDTFLQNRLFQETSRPISLNLNSPTLQNKDGYRQVLRIWLKFELAAKLIWEGGDEVYSGGKKDIATLYEYWLFFKLLDMLKSIFEIEPKDLESLIVSKSDNLNLQLKQGKFTALSGKYTKGNRDLNIRFNYNKTFYAQTDLHKSGSWTTTMRPDYTLSIWPAILEETQAEKEEQIVHVHFDAKYKIANIDKIINVEKNNEDLDEEKNESLKGIYKNVDLLKMHAYKDAIRRTSGAYVLYPGDKTKNLKGFHEILPGLGAFPIKPSEDSGETIHLEKFLKDILNHFLNNASQRENIAVKSYNVHKNENPNTIKEPIPEYVGKEKVIPDETYVLVGYYDSEQKNQWIEKSKMYNFRMGSGNGSLILDKETVSAKYLLLHTKGDQNSSNIWRIKSKGPRVYSKENLIKKGYPDPRKDYYLVIEIEKVAPEDFDNAKWNFKMLSNYKSNRASAKPFTATLTELMKTKVKEIK